MGRRMACFGCRGMRSGASSPVLRLATEVATTLLPEQVAFFTFNSQMASL